MKRLTWKEYNALRQQGRLGELPPNTVLEMPLNPPPQVPADLAKQHAQNIAAWRNPFSAAEYPFTIGTSAKQVLQSNSRRVYLLVQNTSSANMYMSFGGVNAVSIVLPASYGYWEFKGGLDTFCPPNAVYVLGTASGQTGVVVEGVLGSL